MSMWLQIKPLYQNRILTLKREYSAFCQLSEVYRNDIIALTKSMDDSLNSLVALTKNSAIDVREKYIQLDKTADELDRISDKREEVATELEKLLTSFQRERKNLFDLCREAHPHLDAEDLMQLLQEKLIT